MKLVEKHVIKKGHEFWSEIDQLAWASKNLYNSANYLIRQSFFYGHGYINYGNMDKLMQSTEEYQALPAKVSQQVLRGLERNWNSFFKALEEWEVNPNKFLGRPRIPGYKDPRSGRNILVYTIQTLSKPALRQGMIKLSMTGIAVKTLVNPVSICEVRIVPKSSCYVIEVVYEQKPTNEIEGEAMAAIDIGLDNLATVTSNQRGFAPILVNGRPLKSINQFFNKRTSELQSSLPRTRKTSNRIKHLTFRRNQKVNDYLHKSSRFIVDLLQINQIKTLVIGQNAQWKNEIELGKRNNQNFVFIPHARFIDMLTYKCQLIGIEVVIQEESYTSQASFLDGDLIPTYGFLVGKPSFSGKRIRRGLYRSGGGVVLNADVNGSYNILRKAFPNALANGIGSAVVAPRRVNPLKVKAKDMSLYI